MNANRCPLCIRQLFQNREKLVHSITYEELTNWLTKGLTDCLTYWLTDETKHWLTHWLTNLPSDWVSEWVSDWLTDWLTDLQTECIHAWWISNKPFLIIIKKSGRFKLHKLKKWILKTFRITIGLDIRIIMAKLMKPTSFRLKFT